MTAASASDRAKNSAMLELMLMRHLSQSQALPYMNNSTGRTNMA
jgi:hypothetical protein